VLRGVETGVVVQQARHDDGRVGTSLDVSSRGLSTKAISRSYLAFTERWHDGTQDPQDVQVAQAPGGSHSHWWHRPARWGAAKIRVGCRPADALNRSVPADGRLGGQYTCAC